MAGCFYGCPAHSEPAVLRMAGSLLGGEMDKPYKSIEQQIELLESRGVATDGNTPAILLREGYYSIVNGYKAPFIDAAATAAAKDDRYASGTKFADTYALFLFDRSLRETTFHYLIRAEALVRTVCSYTFSEQHRGSDDYLKQDNFATEDEYKRFGLRGYVYNMQKLHKALFEKATKSNRDFILHYRTNYGWVPLWVLANDLTFGNIEHFFNLMRPAEQATVCRRIVEATGMTGGELGFFSPKEMRIGLDIVVKARNMCAHDERMYCARIGKRKNASYLAFLSHLRRYLSEPEFVELAAKINSHVETYSGKSDIVAHILNEMGFSAKRLSR